MVDTRSERALRLHQSEVAVFRKLEIVISKFRGLTSNSETRAQAPCPIHSKIEVCTLLSLPNPCFAALVASQSEIPPKKQNISKSFLALYVTCVARSQLKNATTHTHTIFERKKKSRASVYSQVFGCLRENHKPSLLRNFQIRQRFEIENTQQRSIWRKLCCYKYRKLGFFCSET